MNFLIVFLCKHLLQIHNSSIIIKFKSALFLSISLSIPTWLVTEFTNWSISNNKYIAGVLTCITIDHIIGSIYHALKVKDFTIKKNAIGLLIKLSMCAAAAILFEIIHHTIREATLAYDYLKIVTRLIVILYPAGSAFMNMSALTNGVFPPLGWISKIKTFNRNLDLEKFGNTNPDGQNNN